MIQITCNGNSARCTGIERLTSGMVGLQCEFVFDDAWDGLARTAVFVAGSVQRDVLLTGDTCNVPWEVLNTAGYQLYVGVYGTNAEGTLVIPTVYAKAGGIAAGADPSGDESTDPTLPVWAQMQSEIGNLEELETEDKTNLVNAINEAAKSGGGGGTSDHGKLTNRDSDNQHPISAITGLQAALDGKANTDDIPSLDGYATEQWVEEKGYLTEHQDISGKANVGDSYTKEESDGRYLTEHQSLAEYATKEYVDNSHDSTKQDAITDLEAIRDGASKGATALQSVPDGYATEDYVNDHHDSTKQDALTAGENITIDENGVISAAGGGGKSLLASVTLSELVSSIELSWPEAKQEITILMRQTTRNKSYLEDTTGAKANVIIQAQINGLTDKILWVAPANTANGNNPSSRADIFVSDCLVETTYTGVAEAGNGYSAGQFFSAPRYFNAPVGGINKIVFFPNNSSALFSSGMRFEIWG